MCFDATFFALPPAMAMHASRHSLFNEVKNYVKSHMIQMRLCKDFCANVVPPLPELWKMKENSLTDFLVKVISHGRLNRRPCISLPTKVSAMILDHILKENFRNIGWGFIVLFLLAHTSALEMTNIEWNSLQRNANKFYDFHFFFSHKWEPL